MSGTLAVAHDAVAVAGRDFAGGGIGEQADPRAIATIRGPRIPQDYGQPTALLEPRTATVKSSARPPVNTVEGVVHDA